MKEVISSNSNKYNFIIAGAGLSGLSLAYKIRQHKSLDDKRILLIDKEAKNKNDRTWCYWSKEEGTFEHLVHSKWNNILFADNKFSKSFKINPYQYKMIRGIDFYDHVIPFLQSKANTDFIISPIEKIENENKKIHVQTQKGKFVGDTLFKSYYENIDFSNALFVWQHFKGWVIKTDKDVFKKDEAIFMDFRVEQSDETRFFYVLPTKANEALVEIAIFSGDIPQPEFYDPFMKNYIREILKIDRFEILHEEVGAIPMTGFDFNQNPETNIINIGTNGGSVKTSSGYAFKRIQEDTDRLIELILKGKAHQYKNRKNRFRFYDKIMLNAILTHKTNGAQVFGDLFSKLKPQSVFKFLDEKGSFFHDLKIFTAPPTLPFFKAFLEELKK